MIIDKIKVYHNLLFVAFVLLKLIDHSIAESCNLYASQPW